MTVPWESRLRDDLQALAEGPAPDSPADRALANAKKVRRRRAVVAAAGSLALVAVVAIPVANGLPWGGSGLPFGAGAGAPCETATDEGEPPKGVPRRQYPEFVRAVLAKLPPRDDYSLQSAEGVCAFPGYPANAYAVINLGHNREHGHLTVTIHYRTGPRTCAAMSEPRQETLFCEEGTDTSPLVIGQAEGVDGYIDGYIVIAVQPDTRAVTVGSHGTPVDVAAIRSVATARDLAELLP